MASVLVSSSDNCSVILSSAFGSWEVRRFLRRTFFFTNLEIVVLCSKLHPCVCPSAIQAWCFLRRAFFFHFFVYKSRNHGIVSTYE